MNIRAADFRFEDKRKYYLGFKDSRGQTKAGTKVHELSEMARTRSDFAEADIEARTEKIIDSFVDYLGEVGLLRG